MLLAFLMNTGYQMEYTEEHRPLLESLAYLNQCRTIVEIGVAEAKTTEFLCRGAAPWGGHVWGYDIWGTHGLKDQFEHWSSPEKCTEYLKSKNVSNFTLTKIDSKTQEFQDLIKERHPEIDLAFIDGCHSYDGIKNDFDIVYPLLSHTGIIVFHDTMRIDGCRRFMIDLRTKFNDGTFDVVTFPYGSMFYSDGNISNRRTGISMLVKRSFATLDLPIDEQCDLEENFEAIYEQEDSWYDQELARYNNK